MRGTERQIVRLCRMARETVPGYGDVPLEAVDVFLLLAHAGLTVCEVEDLPLPAIPIPTGEAPRLLVRAGLADTAERFLILRQIGRLMAPPGCRPVVPTVFALCGVLDHASVVGRDAKQERRHRIREIASLTEVWSVVSLRYVLRLTRRMLRRIARQNVAAADPDAARRAYEEGREARRNSEYARAEERFRTAVTTARACRAWETLALAHLGLAQTAKQRGNYPLARRRFGRTLRTARRYRVQTVEGMVLHDLFVLACDMCEMREAMHLAEEAFDIYRETRHRSLPRLAHDVGYYWITVGDYESALLVLRETLSFVSPSEGAMVVWGNVARAAAATGRVEQFQQARMEAERLARDSASQEYTARSLLYVALGATTLGEWVLAETTALRALEVASWRGESRIRFEAEALLANLRTRQSVEVPQVLPTKRRRTLAVNLVETLRERLSSLA